jgi:hypothetical protein
MNNNTTLTNSVLQSSINWNDSTENYIKNAPQPKDFILSRANADAIRKLPSFLSHAGSIVVNDSVRDFVVESAKSMSFDNMNGGLAK